MFMSKTIRLCSRKDATVWWFGILMQQFVLKCPTKLNLKYRAMEKCQLKINCTHASCCISLSHWKESKYSSKQKRKTMMQVESTCAYNTPKRLKPKNKTIELRVYRRSNYGNMRDMNVCFMFSLKERSD